MIVLSRIGTPFSQAAAPGERRTSADDLRPVQRANGGWKERRARLHAVVAVTTSVGRLLLRCASPQEVPERIAPPLLFQTKPESVRKQRGSENVIAPSRIGTPFSQAAAPVAPSFRSVSTELLARGQDDPISHRIVSAKGDLRSWLRLQNIAATSPRLSQSKDSESWLVGIVAEWEGQCGPIDDKEVLPPEI